MKSPDRWLWLFPPVYFIHLLDERYFGIGTADFAAQQFDIYFTNTAWWWVNVPSMLLLTLATALLVRGTWPAWVAIALAVHLSYHGLGRVPTSLWTSSIAPGLLSGLLLCTPLALATAVWARGRFSRPQVLRGLVAGHASFQPLWHLLLLPILPEAPGP
jgi:hypothetical protein